MKQKTLCINLGYGGGCVYYANNLIKYLTVRKEVWIYGTVTSPMRMRTGNSVLPAGCEVCFGRHCSYCRGMYLN